MLVIRTKGLAVVRYIHADSNLYSHIFTLRVISGILALGLITALFGWYHAARVQRISIPPNLNYGGEVTLNSIHSWEVYNFAGYIWQQLNRCPYDCLQDYPKNLERLTAFLTPSFKAWLIQKNEEKTKELTGRTRYILPIHTDNFFNSIVQENPNQWTVTIDVELREHIRGVLVKNARIRYFIRVIALPVDPESNPWGLMLDSMPQKTKRLGSYEKK